MHLPPAIVAALVSERRQTILDQASGARRARQARRARRGRATSQEAGRQAGRERAAAGAELPAIPATAGHRHRLGVEH